MKIRLITNTTTGSTFKPGVSSVYILIIPAVEPERGAGEELFLRRLGQTCI